MNPKIKEKWLEALRSGKYQQAQGRLRQISTIDGKNELRGYCCLGVLCDLHRKTKKKRGIGWDNGMYKAGTMGQFEAHYLPKPVREWAGLTQANPRVKYGLDGSDTLGSLNDRGENFQHIADVIEKKL